MISVILDIKNETKFTFSAKDVEKVILDVLKNHNITGEIEVGLKLVSKNVMQKMNKEYRGKDMPTDVLSFPLVEDLIHNKNTLENCPLLLLGDIVVCPAIIKKNAKEFESTDEKEFLKMIEHSTLHLIGIHHKGD